MKHSIAWNKNCLDNWRAHLHRKKAELALLQAEIDRTEKYIMLYDSKIIRAEAIGKKEFDEYKFGIKK